MNDALEQSNWRMWRALGLTLETRSIEPQGHIDRVATLAVALAAELGLSSDEIQAVQIGAYLHDLGKLELPRQILQDAQLLSEDQWKIVQTHVQLGIELIEYLDLPKAAQDLILFHHERWDGTGYPHGLSGLKIPLSARLFAVVDAFVAMTADWFTRRAVSGTGALYELWNERGTAFEPRIVEALARVLRLEISAEQNYKNTRIAAPQFETVERQNVKSQTQFALLDERGYVCFASPKLRKHLDPKRGTLLDILELVEAKKRPQLLEQVEEVRHAFLAALEMSSAMPSISDQLQHIQTKLVPDEFGTSGMVLLWIETAASSQNKVFQSSNLMRQALASSDVSVLLTDHNQCLLEVSPAFLRSTGYTLTEVLGRTPRMLQGSKSSREALEVLRYGIENKISCQTEVINYRKDGSEFWAQISITPIYSSDGSVPYFIGVQHDISVLRKHQLEQRRLLELVEDSIVITDLQGFVTYSNIHAEAMLNTKLGKAIWVNLEESDIVKMQQAIDDLAIASQPFSLQTKAYPSVGWSRHLAWSVSISISDGRLFWVGRDITELHLISLQQQQQHQFVSSVLDTAASLLIVCDAQCKIVRVNKTFETMLQIKSEAVIGLDITDVTFFSTKDLEALFRLFQGANNTNKVVIPLLTTLQNYQISWSIKNIFKPNNQLEFIVFTGIDITERLNQESQIRESELRYRTVVESINDAILRINATGRVTYSNPAWHRLSGYSNGLTLSSSSVLKFVHRNHRQAILRQVLRAISQQQASIKLEVRLVSRASRLRWAEATMHMLYESEIFIGITIMLTDITNQKEKNVQYHLSHSQNKLYNSEDLSAALHALSQFLGAQNAQISAKDFQLSIHKDETIAFQPDLDTIFTQENISVLRLESEQGLQGFLIMRWYDLAHLAESTTLLEYQAAFTESLERVFAYRNIIEREERSQQFIEVTLRAQETERERIAIDLHDGPAQTMVSALRFIETSLETTEIENTTLKKQLERSLELLKSSIQQVRETITDLIPPDLEILGLSDVLRQRLEEISRSEQWQTEFHFDPVRLSRDTEVTLYRIVIEALNNTRRHAQANKVRLNLWHDKVNTILEIQDNGIGFDSEKPRINKLHHGIGTIGMKKRAELLGAQLVVYSIPNHGTTVRLVLPNKAERIKANAL